MDHPRPSNHPRDLHSLLVRAASQHPQATAIAAPGRPRLTYVDLARQIDAAVRQLNDLGYGRGTRLASVLSPGPEQAVAQLTLMIGAVCAPLNPGLRSSELRAAFEQLRVDAVVVERQNSESAVAAAAAAGIHVIELYSPAGEAAGVFELGGRPHAGPVHAGTTAPGDVVLVLQTSGTTYRPKIVPLTNRNLCAAAKSICAAVELADRDVCLNVMPLFHIHGLSTVISSLVVGASVVCPPGFLAPRFLDWAEEFRPSWYTSAPTIHRAVLGVARRNRLRVRDTSFRFLRSASSAMPATLIVELEEIFECPFVEAYGMTEASPQIASNRLFPSGRRAGSVGRPAGPEVAIMGERGDLVRSGDEGEIVVRGENVMTAYEDDPDANEAAFAHGWLRTGDLGRFDNDGFLFVTGRLKEIINRGGEKIAPAELDKILLRHPAVAEAVTFGFPDERLGEDVAAAIVLRDGAAATEAEIRRFVALSVADFKVPARIVVVDVLPTSDTGKVRRVDLAAHLLAGAVPVTSMTRTERSASALEELVANTWSEVLDVADVESDSNFFELGGDSLLAARIVARLREAGAEIDVVTFFEEPTVSGVSRRLMSADPPPGLPPLSELSEDLALTSSQRSLWLLEQLSPGSALYNVSRTVRLIGPLDIVALGRSLDDVVARHEALRTRFYTQEGLPRQVVCPPAAVRLAVENVAEGSLQSVLEGECRRPLDLGPVPLLRARLLRCAPDEHVLSLTTHHMVVDGWSMAIILRELGHYYNAHRRGRAPDLPPPAAQFRQFVSWQGQWLRSGESDRLLALRRADLEGAPDYLQLTAAVPRPGGGRNEGAHLQTSYDGELSREVDALARQQQTTPYVVLLAAFAVLLQRLSGQYDILVATPAANRPLLELEDAVGLFSNTGVVRLQLSGRPTFSDVVRSAHRSSIRALAHQALPFDQLVAAVSPSRRPDSNPLAQVNFRYVPRLELPHLADIVCTPVQVETGAARFDLALELQRNAGGLTGFLEYRTALFSADWAAGVADAYAQVLREYLGDPNAAVLSPAAAVSARATRPAFPSRARSG